MGSDQKLVVGKELPISSGFDEDFYIGRKVDRVEIDEEKLKSDIKSGKFQDRVVYREEDFEKMSLEDEKTSIHFSVNENGKSFWIQSSGSIENLQKYRKGEEMNDKCLQSEDEMIDCSQSRDITLIS